MCASFDPPTFIFYVANAKSGSYAVVELTRYSMIANEALKAALVRGVSISLLGAVGVGQWSMRFVGQLVTIVELY